MGTVLGGHWVILREDTVQVPPLWVLKAPMELEGGRDSDLTCSHLCVGRGTKHWLAWRELRVEGQATPGPSPSAPWKSGLGLF